MIKADSLSGGDDDSDNDHEAFPDDGPAEFGGKHGELRSRCSVSSGPGFNVLCVHRGSERRADVRRPGEAASGE